MLRSRCSGKLGNNNTRATVGGRDTVSLAKTHPSLSARNFCTLGLSRPLLASPNTQSSEEHQAWPQPGAGKAAAGPADGRPGDADKGCRLCAPSLFPIPPRRTLAADRKVGCILGGDEITESMHRPSRSSPVPRHRGPEQPQPPPRPPALPRPPPPVVPVSPGRAAPSAPACSVPCLRRLAESAALCFPWGRGVRNCSEEQRVWAR